MRLTLPRPGDRGERGSLVVALTVIMVLVSLSATVLTRTLYSETSVLQDTGYEAAKAQADAALSDALFRIDQFGENDIHSFCVAPGNTYCSLTSVPSAPGAEYTAAKVDDNTMLVRAQGSVAHGLPFTLQATVKRSMEFPFAIYAVQSATFKGNVGGVTTNDSNFPANVGSAGTIDCTGQGHVGNGQYANQTTGCANPQPMTQNYNPQDPSTASTCAASNDTSPPPSPPIPCVPSTASTACPSTWGTGTYSGTYLCTSSVTLSGTINVGAGGLYIYFVPGSGATFNLTNSAVINPTSDAVGGDPTQFGLWVGGSQTLTFDGSSPTINGTVWAPHTDLTSNGCKLTVDGAVVVQSLLCHGGPNLTVTYDNRIQTEVQRAWTTTDYQVTGQASFSLPTCSNDTGCGF